MVDCENCSASNDPKLTFCRNCGHRLKSQGRAGASAQAQTQVQPSPVQAAAAPAAAKKAPANDTLVEDDEAPPIELARADSKERSPAPGAAKGGGVTTVEADGRLRCGQCNVLSPKDYRFCVGCGAVLARQRDIAPAALASAMWKSRRSVRPPKEVEGEPPPKAAAKPAAKPIELKKEAAKSHAERVEPGWTTPAPLELLKEMQREAKKEPPAKAPPRASDAGKAPKPPEASADAKPAGRQVSCARCGGQCDAAEAFCKFCGAPLNKGRVGPDAGANGEDGEETAAVKRDAKAEAKAEAKRDEPKREPKRPEPKREPPRPKDAFPLSDPGRDEQELDLALEVDLPPASEPRPISEPRRAPATVSEDATEEPSGQLVVIVEDGSEGTAIDLRGPQMDIGSAEGDIVLPEDRYLSPRHARLFRQEGEWYLRDLDSLNGVYRRLRKPAALRHGDLVLLGLEVLQFQLVDHAEKGLGHAVQHGVLLFGSPATQRRARLCQRTVEGVIRDVYHLVGDETTIGREIGDVVFTSDPFMSRRHAMLKWHEPSEEYLVSDLSSSNGTYVAIREDVRLENGDFIRLGQHLFRVDLQAAAEAAGRGGR